MISATMANVELDNEMENVALEEDFVHDQLPSPDEIKLQIHETPSHHFSRRRLLLAVTAVGLSVIFGTVLGVFVNNKSYEPDRLTLAFEFLKEQTKSNDLTKPTSPQHKAAMWIAVEDPKQLPLNHRFLQRYALMVLWFATNGPSSWQHDLNFGHPLRDECHWNQLFPTVGGSHIQLGVTCNPGHRVTGLIIKNNSLTGPIPPELGLLTELHRLMLDHNGLSGALPDSLEHMSHLEVLTASYNAFSSTIPGWFSNLQQLSLLVLSNNHLTSTIPDELSSLTTLKTIALGDNHLSGNLTVLDRMHWLEELYLEDNELAGTIDNFFLPDLLNLTVLDLSGNSFEGQVPRGMLRRSQLRVLDLHDNLLSGTLPKDIPRSTTLEFLAAQGNDISGTIPTTMFRLVALTHLDLSSNRMEGPIPNELGEVFTLQNLFLSNNLGLAPGPIPDSLGQFSSLRECSLRGTHRTGTMPTFLGNLGELVLLDVSHNQLRGSIPESLGSLGNMQYLLVNGNELTGRLPDTFGALSNLDVFLLDNNTVVGDADAVCGLLLETFVSDCAGDIPELNCTCCTVCCRDEEAGCSDEVAMAHWKAMYQRHYQENDLATPESNIVVQSGG